MQTLITDSVEEAARRLRSGELVAFPTETVYGLGADAFNEHAVRSIFEAKERPSDNPLIVHIADTGQLSSLCTSVSSVARTLIDHFFPGPLTLILPRHPSLPHAVTAGLDTVGVRMPRHPIAANFLRLCDTPVAAPSANRSGRPSPTTWQAVHEDLEGRIACILRGGRSEVGLESTVVDCTQPAPAVLRTGAVTIEALRAVLPSVRSASSDPENTVRSPGLRHRHYAPRARVELVADASEATGNESNAYIGLKTSGSAGGQFQIMILCEDLDQYAHALFDFFRRCDAEGVETIYCQRVDETGLGVALMDRLRRASSER